MTGGHRICVALSKLSKWLSEGNRLMEIRRWTGPVFRVPSLTWPPEGINKSHWHHCFISFSPSQTDHHGYCHYLIRQTVFRFVIVVSSPVLVEQTLLEGQNVREEKKASSVLFKVVPFIFTCGTSWKLVHCFFNTIVMFTGKKTTLLYYVKYGIINCIASKV